MMAAELPNRRMPWFRWDDPESEHGSVARRVAHGFQGTARRIAQWAEHDWLPGEPGWSVLDVPCGNANYYPLFAAIMGMHYEGCDLSREMIALSRELYPGAVFHEADVTALPFDDGSFDMTFCTDLLLHLPAELEGVVVAELRRVARRVAVVHTRPVLAPPRMDGRGAWGTISRYETLDYCRELMRDIDPTVEEHRRNDRELPGGRAGADVFFLFRE